MFSRNSSAATHASTRLGKSLYELINIMTSQETKLPFKIEDNVLIGDEEEIENSNLAELFLNTFKAKPDFIGQVDALTGKQNTFREMRERSVKCALWLKKQGVKPGDIIVTSTHNHLDTYIPFLASLYIDATMSSWSENISIKNMQRALELSTPKVIFTNSNNAISIYRQALLLRVSTKIVVFDEIKLIGEDRDLAKKFDMLDSILEGKFDEAEVTGFSYMSKKSILDTVLIMYSSGSTGTPKAVEISQAMLLSPSIVQSVFLVPGDVVLWFGSLNWITCVLMTIRSILSYATAIKFAGFDSEKICRAIEKYKVTWMLIETGLCHQLVKSSAITKYNVSSLRQVLFTGSTIRHNVHESIGKALPDISMTMYGMTELGIVSYQIGTKKIGSSGCICKNVRLKIVNLETKKPLGPNAHGEVYVKCSFMMNGYYRDPVTTKNSFGRNGWFRTGDIGYYDKDGYIFIVDRIKNLIKYRGHHVSSVDIESLLGSHPAVRDSAVIAVPHGFDGQHPIAFVTKLSGAEVTEEELEELVATNMEDQNKLRGGVVFIANLPRLVNGKVDRMALRNLVKK